MKTDIEVNRDIASEFRRQAGSNHPKVSLIMAVYNGGKYLSEALDSILDQTFTEFELIVINDASTDDSGQIISECAAQDERVLTVQNEENLGLTQSLNKGVAMAKGEYIARQDADDVSLPKRLEYQVRYLDEHSDVGVLGTAYYRLYTNGKRSLRQPPLSHTELRWRLLFGNIWCHSTMMFRASLVEGNTPSYNPQFRYAQDYDLWTRLLSRTRGATLSVPLIVHRIHDSSMTATMQAEKIGEPHTISGRQIKSFMPSNTLTVSEIEQLHRCHTPQRGQLREADLAMAETIFSLLEIFAQEPGIDPAVVKFIRRRWIKRLIASIPLKQWREAWRSGLAGAILKHDPAALLIAGFVHLPAKLASGLARR